MLVPCPVTKDTITPFAIDLAWKQMDELGHVQTVFYDGSAKNSADFAIILLASQSFMLWDTDKEKWVWVSWAWPASNGWAEVHFCPLDEYKRDMGVKAMQIYKKVFHGVYGIIPESNVSAQRLVRLLGWKRAGTFPKYCNMVHKKTREAGTIWHKVLGD